MEECSSTNMEDNHDQNPPSSSKSTTITEGGATVSFSSQSSTFYNPVQEFNRDLTVTVLRQFVEDRLNETTKSKALDEGNDTNGGCGEGENPASSSSMEPPTKKRKYFKSSEDSSIRILDALSASGLRALRFAKEVPRVAHVVANDFSENAVETIRGNIAANGLEGVVEARFGDAVTTMMEHRSLDRRFDAIDLDPYGSPSVFLDSAMQAIADGGLLMVTCTDMAVLCGNTPEACFAKYGSVPIRHKCCHEFYGIIALGFEALRIVLRALDSHATRYARYISPVLSVSVDFYIRVFVRVFSGARGAKDSIIKQGYVFNCSGCHTMTVQPLAKKTVNGVSIRYSPLGLFSSSGDSPDPPAMTASGQCIHCSHTMHLAGPIWTAPMHDREFVMRMLNGLKNEKVKTQRGEQVQEGGKESVLGTHDRLVGILSVISEELPDVPLYYELDQLMNIVKAPMPRAVVLRSAVLNAGFRCSSSHCNPRGLKTDAPAQLLWDIARHMAKEARVRLERFDQQAAGYRIMQASTKFAVSLALHAEAESRSRADQLLRYQYNRGKNWGPKAKAHGSVNSVRAGFHNDKREARGKKGIKSEDGKAMVEDDERRQHDQV